MFVKKYTHYFYILYIKNKKVKYSKLYCFYNEIHIYYIYTSDNKCIIYFFFHYIMYIDPIKIYIYILQNINDEILKYIKFTTKNIFYP